jgi:hypothetical protein
MVPYQGKQLEDFRYEDLRRLRRAELLALFRQLEAPAISEVRGEYRAALLDCGHMLNTFLAWFYLYFIWGTWQHKAFEPLGDTHGHGYNTFITTQSKLYENCFRASLIKTVHIAISLFRPSAPQRLARIMLNKTSLVASVFDGRPAFQLSYRDYNTFYTNTMTDEVRKVNEHLLLGIGRLTITFGKFNPMPFVLMGPPDPWRGPDIPYPGQTRTPKKPM